MAVAIFDDGGTSWASITELAARLGAESSGAHFEDYVLRNMGFLRLARNSRSFTVEFWPDRLRPNALTAALYVLHDEMPDRIVLTLHSNEGPKSTLLGFKAAMQRILEVYETSQVSRVGDFLRNERDAALIEGDHPFARIFDRWREHNAAVAQSKKNQRTDLIEDLKTLVDNKYLLVTATERKTLVLSECGSGRSAQTRRWVGSVVGARPQDVPDFSYGAWVTNSYTKALEFARPIVDDIDCILEWPGQGRTRVTYERLILPLYDEHGTATDLFVASLRNPRINLRRSVHACLYA